jgi:hypothetical protein
MGQSPSLIPARREFGVFGTSYVPMFPKPPLAQHRVGVRACACKGGAFSKGQGGCSFPEKPSHLAKAPSVRKEELFPKFLGREIENFKQTLPSDPNIVETLTSDIAENNHCNRTI